MLKAIVELAETITKLARDWVTHLIALALIGVSLVLISHQLWNPNEDDLKTAQGIASIVGPWVGVVVGFYFGERGGVKQAEAAAAKADVASKTKIEALASVDDAKGELADLQNQLDNIRNALSEAGL